MNHSISVGFICSILLVSLTGVCIADVSPSAILYLQGGDTIITNGSSGTIIITAQDIIPYFHVPVGNMSYLMPVEHLPDFTFPIHAAVVLSSENKDNTSIVMVENLTLTDNNSTLILQVTHQEYNEGSALVPFAENGSELPVGEGEKFDYLGLYLEYNSKPPSNYGECCWNKACMAKCLTDRPPEVYFYCDSFCNCEGKCPF